MTATLARMWIAGTRLPPEVVRLAPPRVPFRRVWREFATGCALVILIGGLGFALLFAALTRAAGGLGPALAAGLGQVFVIPVLCVLAVPVMLLPGLIGARWAMNRRAARWRATHSDALAEPRAAALVRELERTGKPDYRCMAAVLGNSSGGAKRCCIVCDAQTQPPDTVAALTEPLIIGPARIVPLGLVGVTSVAVALAITAFLVGPRFLRVSPATAFLLTLAAVAAVFVLRGVLWPRYLRFCPGRVEVLRYGLLGLRSRRVEFPLDGETTVFVGVWPSDAQAAALVDWRVVVCRGQVIFKVRFVTGAREGGRLWQALLSGAQAPRLPADTL